MASEPAVSDDVRHILGELLKLEAQPLDEDLARFLRRARSRVYTAYALTTGELVIPPMEEDERARRKGVR